MIKFPLFIFYKDQMIVTDKTEIAEAGLRDFVPGIEAFDASGLKLRTIPRGKTIGFSESPDSGVQESDLRQKISQFLLSSGDPVKGIRDMSLDQLTQSMVEWLKTSEWKLYRRGSRLFWTMMLPCGLIPFAIGLFKIPMDTSTLTIYIGCFTACLLILVWLFRTLYARPRFPDPRKT